MFVRPQVNTQRSLVSNTQCKHNFCYVVCVQCIDKLVLVELC